MTPTQNISRYLYMPPSLLPSLPPYLQGMCQGRATPAGHGLQTVLGHGDGTGGGEEDLREGGREEGREGERESRREE